MTAYPKTYAVKQIAIDKYDCRFCGAKPREHCRVRSGDNAGAEMSVAQTHKSRVTEMYVKLGLDDDGVAPKPLKIRWGLPPKLAHKVRTRHYIWCDHHGSIHETNTDPFGEGYEGDPVCEPDQWRRIYIESDDKKETF